MQRYPEQHRQSSYGGRCSLRSPRWLPALLLAVAGTIATPAMAEVDQALVEALMRDSGLSQQMDSSAANMQAEIVASLHNSPRLSQLSARQHNELIQVADRDFSPARFRGEALGAMQRTIDPGHLPALKTWYQSPLGRKITAIERASPVDGGAQAAMAEAGARRLQIMPAARVALLQRIVVATHSVDAAIEMMVAIAEAAGRGEAEACGKAFSAQELRAKFAQMRPQMQQAIADQSLAFLAKLYGTLTDEELLAYVQFLESSAGSDFHWCVSQATQIAFAAVMQGFVHDVSQLADRWRQTK